jgi:REP element-mobilizing transposase RayT
LLHQAFTGELQEKPMIDNNPGSPGNATLPSGPYGAPNGGLGSNVNDVKKQANQEIGDPGWHSRGYLPHFDGQEVTQHITFHLADSLAKEALQRLDEEIRCLPSEKQKAERRKRVDAWIDAGHGSCLLREPAIANMVQNAFLFFDGQRYRLLAWVVMPNHVHVLFQPMDGWTVAKIVASWKKYTATQICAFRRLSASGEEFDGPKPVWHREYWDRFIRDDRHYEQALEYVHLNPVKAGLCTKAEDWPWSSASIAHQEANT